MIIFNQNDLIAMFFLYILKMGSSNGRCRIRSKINNLSVTFCLDRINLIWKNFLISFLHHITHSCETLNN